MTQRISTPYYLITTGDPSGIGMDIALSALMDRQFLGELGGCVFVVTACLAALKERAKVLYQLGRLSHMPSIVAINPDKLRQCQSNDTIWVIDTPCATPPIAGTPNPANAMMIKTQLDIAHHLASIDKVQAIITAPLAKSVMIKGGVCLDDGELFSGHTEYFMTKCGLDKVVMMLANQTMKVALVTTHIPLKDVPAAITKDAVASTVQIVHDELVAKFGKVSPNILVCGLNPHAGEGGYLGREEIEVINPVLQAFQAQGMTISTALPADTLFTQKYLADCDAIIAMYHDQGLAPLKSHGFGDTVNITLGLPYVRTSVDHGTAFDLAGTGQASDSSLKQAIRYAIIMTKH